MCVSGSPQGAWGARFVTPQSWGHVAQPQGHAARSQQRREQTWSSASLEPEVGCLRFRYIFNHVDWLKNKRGIRAQEWGAGAPLQLSVMRWPPAFWKRGLHGWGSLLPSLVLLLAGVIWLVVGSFQMTGAWKWGPPHLKLHITCLNYNQKSLVLGATFTCPYQIFKVVFQELLNTQVRHKVAFCWWRKPSRVSRSSLWGQTAPEGKPLIRPNQKCKEECANIPASFPPTASL